MQKLEKKLSIIVGGVFDVSKIEETLESINRQIYKNIEVILVNNGSIDEEVISKYKDVKVVNVDECSLLQTYVKGISSSEGDYVTFLFPGDEVSIDFYRALMDKAEKTDSDIVLGNYLEKDNEEKYIYNLLMNPIHEINGEDVFKTFFRQEGLNNLWNFIVNKIYKRDVVLKAIEEIGKHDSNDYILLSYELFLNANKVNKIDNDMVWCLKENVVDYNLDNVISDFEFIENSLKKHKVLDKWKDSLQCWKNIYTKFLEDKGIKYKKFNDNYKKVYDDEYYYLIRTKWNDKLEELKEMIASSDIKMVSFDIFDTLVVRPFYSPADLFNVLDKYFREWTNNKTALEFYNVRVDSEVMARDYKKKMKADSQDVTLDEIYDAMARRYRLDDKLLNKLKEKEIELEIKYCNVRHVSYDIYSYALYLDKKVICTSDMYLPKDVLVKILDKNEYNDLTNVYVSCEYDMTKGSGDLFDYVVKDNGMKESEVIHIGDNYAADYEMPKKKGLVAFHLPRTVDVLNDAGYTNGLSAIFNAQLPFWIDNMNGLNNFYGIRSMVCVAANKYFDNPFIPYNDKTDFNADPYLIGYYLLGSYMFGLNKWMLDDMQGKGYDKLVFMARDGYLPIECYKKMKPLYKDQPKEEYLYISRKALIPVNIQDKMDFYKLTETLNILKNSPLDIINYVINLIDYDEKKFDSLCKKKNINVKNKFKDMDDFYTVIEIIINNFYDKNKQENYLKHVKKFFSDIYGKHSATFDIGYSARPSYFISNLLGQPIDTYFCNINHSQALRHSQMGNFKLNIFFDGRPSTTGHAYEMLLSALAPSCIRYDLNEKSIEPVFEKYHVDSSVEYAITTMQNAALDFVTDMVDLFGEDISMLYMQNYYSGLPFLTYMNASKEIDKYPFSSVLFEDNLAIGEQTKMIRVWEDELKLKNQYPILSLVNMNFEQDEGFNRNRLVYNSNIDLRNKNKFMRLLFYVLYDRDTFKRRISEIKFNMRNKKRKR